MNFLFRLFDFGLEVMILLCILFPSSFFVHDTISKAATSRCRFYCPTNSLRHFPILDVSRISTPHLDATHQTYYFSAVRFSVKQTTTDTSSFQQKNNNRYSIIVVLERKTTLLGIIRAMPCTCTDENELRTCGNVGFKPMTINF